MTNYEELGAFYLGRNYDLQSGQTQPAPLLYDAKDLTTHAVCVGMTGSGKTGLCLALLEEAAIDGVPAICIDPKGDLGNLLLTFPELSPQEFAPWVDAGEATRQGQTVEQYARQTASMWREGLAEWDQTPDRIARFKSSVDIGIYTPGSDAGIPLSILRSFAAPPPAVMKDSDALRECIMSAVSGLMALIGVDADPIRSREHIFLSTIMDHAWREGRSLDLPGLIREIQTPPFNKIGVMDLDTIFPQQDRFALSMQLNNILASPGFSSWMKGEPLDVHRLLYTSDGKPRLSIISIAHLSDTERMFFVTTLLNAMVAWMRSQPGTSSLRALLYMDEVFGYFPPTAMPPSKLPMLTLLKQARAFGLGCVLATQNPVDLDYKGLSNCGTWFLGRLQTERDKARVLDGLESASSNTGANFNRAEMESILSSLGNRVFLMNNVHDDGPVVFQTRWALSYLRGPLTRSQIETLMAPRKAAAMPPPAVSEGSPAGMAAGKKGDASDVAPTSRGSQRPLLPPGIDESFILPARPLIGNARLVYRPAIYGLARLHFAKSTAKIDHWEDVALHCLMRGSVPDDPWEQSEPIAHAALEFSDAPDDAASQFADLASDLTKAKNYTAWKTALKNHLYRNQTMTVYACKPLKAKSHAGETEGEFRVRLKQLAAEQRDLEVEKLRKKYAPKLKRLADRIETAAQRVEREEGQVGQQWMKTAISVGQTLLGAVVGRKLTSATNVSRAASSMRSAGRIASEKGDVERAKESHEKLLNELAALNTEFEEATDQLRARFEAGNLEVDATPIRPRKSDLTVEKVALVWTPWMVDSAGIAEQAY